jgi:hypothetical protein
MIQIDETRLKEIKTTRIGEDIYFGLSISPKRASFKQERNSVVLMSTFSVNSTLYSNV